MSAALISACNEALALIMKGRISSLDEGTPESINCNIFAQPLLDELADWATWPQFIKRVVLAQVTNDRPAEWLYAYEQPSDYGEPIAIRAVEEDATMLPELSMPYTLPAQDRQKLGFIVEGGKVYSNVKDATLVYTRDEITANDLTPMMRRAYVDELAARLAVPVGKLSANKIDAMMRRAMASKYEAIADAQNKNPTIEPNYKSMAEYAREGLLE